MLVFGDSIREQDERFNVRITAENSEDEISTASFSVTIQDDGDCKYSCLINHDSIVNLSPLYSNQGDRKIFFGWGLQP